MRAILIAPLLTLCACVGEPFELGSNSSSNELDAGKAPEAMAVGLDAFEASPSSTNEATLEAASVELDAGSGNETGCVLITHTNGIGQAWADCAPIGSYSTGEAMSACLAWANTVPNAAPCVDHDVLSIAPCGVRYVASEGTPSPGGPTNRVWIYAAADYAATPGSVFVFIPPLLSTCAWPTKAGKWE